MGGGEPAVHSSAAEVPFGSYSLSLDVPRWSIHAGSQGRVKPVVVGWGEAENCERGAGGKAGGCDMGVVEEPGQAKCVSLDSDLNSCVDGEDSEAAVGGRRNDLVVSSTSDGSHIEKKLTREEMVECAVGLEVRLSQLVKQDRVRLHKGLYVRQNRSRVGTVVVHHTLVLAELAQECVNAGISEERGPLESEEEDVPATA